VFHHAAGNLPSGEAANAKITRINEIHASGLSVAHVIHRHDLDELTALEVEAALIDAYPGLTNLVAGHGVDDRGTAHADEIVRRYQAEPAVFAHKVLLVGVNRTAIERGIYNGARFSWALNRVRAEAIQYVLAIRQGLIVGAFIADEWQPATVEHFGDLASGREDAGRLGFKGREAPAEIQTAYVGKKLPEGVNLSQAGTRYVDQQSLVDESK
jgi:hypothetical protein